MFPLTEKHYLVSRPRMEETGTVNRYAAANRVQTGIWWMAPNSHSEKHLTIAEHVAKLDTLAAIETAKRQLLAMLD